MQNASTDNPYLQNLPPDFFDRDSVLREAIQWSGVNISLERLLDEEPRIDALELYLANCRSQLSDYLLPPLLLRTEHVARIAARIRFRAELTAHPEVLTRPIERPIVVTGLFRTGTTVLYNLLALQDEVRAPRTWEMQNPVPAPHPDTMANDPRIERLQMGFDKYLQFAPEFRAIHDLRADAPEECTFIMRGDYAMETSLYNLEFPNVVRWLLAQDFHMFYQHHRTVLQYLGLHFRPDLRWVLKSPFHLAHLNVLLDTYPDAQIVLTHRDPAVVVASSLSLFSVFAKKNMALIQSTCHCQASARTARSELGTRHRRT